MKPIMELLIGLSFLTTLYRFFKGPEILDRLLCYSSLSAKIVVILVLEGVFFHRTVFINIAMVYAILSFLGIVIVARFIEREEGK